MTGWRDLARRLKEQERVRDNGDNGANSAPAVNSVLIVPIVLGGVSLSHVALRDDPATWTAALARLNTSRPPAGFDRERWQRLVTDARWLCDHHGYAAHGLGWTASDLFGIGPPNGLGGLADRLEGARHVVLTDRTAYWRCADLEGWLSRPTMRAMPPIWIFSYSGALDSGVTGDV